MVVPTQMHVCGGWGICVYYASLQAGRRLFRRDYPMRDFIVKKKSLIHFCLRDSQGEALIQSAIASMESILPFLLLTYPSLSLSTFSHSPLHLQYSFLFSSPFTKFAAFFVVVVSFLRLLSCAFICYFSTIFFSFFFPFLHLSFFSCSSLSQHPSLCPFLIFLSSHTLSFLFRSPLFLSFNLSFFISFSLWLSLIIWHVFSHLCLNFFFPNCYSFFSIHTHSLSSFVFLQSVSLSLFLISFFLFTIFLTTVSVYHH